MTPEPESTPRPTTRTAAAASAPTTSTPRPTTSKAAAASAPTTSTPRPATSKAALKLAIYTTDEIHSVEEAQDFEYIDARVLKCQKSKQHRTHFGTNDAIMHYTSVHPDLPNVLADIKAAMDAGAKRLAIFCRHGRHRSVSLAELIAAVLDVQVHHQTRKLCECRDCNTSIHSHLRMKAVERVRRLWQELQ